jgi:hypothetical protein
VRVSVLVRRTVEGLQSSTRRLEQAADKLRSIREKSNRDGYTDVLVLNEVWDVGITLVSSSALPHTGSDQASTQV